MTLNPASVSIALALCVALACAPEHAGDGDDRSDAHDAETHVPGRVELSERQLASADVEVETAGPGEVWESLVLAATVVSNADAVLHVNPRVPGLRVVVVRQAVDDQLRHTRRELAGGLQAQWEDADDVIARRLDLFFGRSLVAHPGLPSDRDSLARTQ